MSWDYRFTERAIKQLRKLGPQASQRVIAFLDERIKACEEVVNELVASICDGAARVEGTGSVIMKLGDEGVAPVVMGRTLQRGSQSAPVQASRHVDTGGIQDCRINVDTAHESIGNTRLG